MTVTTDGRHCWYTWTVASVDVCRVVAGWLAAGACATAAPPPVATDPVVPGAWPTAVEMPPATFWTRAVTGPTARLRSAPTLEGPTITAAVNAEAITATEPSFRRFI